MLQLRRAQLRGFGFEGGDFALQAGDFTRLIVLLFGTGQLLLEREELLLRWALSNEIKRIAEHVYYSGSVDYTSTNPWGELAEEKAAKLPGKGMIERDLSTGKQQFHPLPVTRSVYDLAAIDGRGMSAADLDRAIQRAVAKLPEGIDGKVVRLVIENVPRHIAREVDHKALRELQRRALHFQLDTRRPEVVRAQRGNAAAGRRPSLAQTLREALNTRGLPAGVERDPLVSLGLKYLEEAERSETTRELPGVDA